MTGQAPNIAALPLGAAIALGLSRFSYGLLLPSMRADLGWTYLLAGAMNTANALGYLIGALATPWLMRRVSPQRLLLVGALLTGVFMMVSGLVTATGILLLQRILAGISSAFIFIAGGILAARLGALHPGRSGLLLGLYYGGTGFGIAASALLVPAALSAAMTHAAAHRWQWPWLALAALIRLLSARTHMPTAENSGNNLYCPRILPYSNTISVINAKKL